MHIQDIFRRHPTTFSFEFFPPKTDEASDELFVTIARLQELKPSFVSVTYGAGGSTRERTHDLVCRIQKETALTAVSHLTCVCHSRDEMAAILDRYAASGIENVLALGGDPPKNLVGYDRAKDGFKFADELVTFVRGRTNTADRRGFGVGVAGFPEGHPGCPNRLKEMDYLKTKVDAGADYICTQLFFDNRDFYDYQTAHTLEQMIRIVALDKIVRCDFLFSGRGEGGRIRDRTGRVGGAVLTIGSAAQHGHTFHSDTEFRHQRGHEFEVAPALPRVRAECHRRFSSEQHTRGRGDWRRIAFDAAHDAGNRGRHVSRFPLNERAEIEHSVAQLFRLPFRRIEGNAVAPDHAILNARGDRLERFGELATRPGFEVMQHSGGGGSAQVVLPQHL